jgi:hypothetical protein
MGVGMLIESIATTRRRLAHKIRESSSCFTIVRRKRRAMALWILTAYRAQIVALVLFLFLQFGFPRMRDAALERSFPEGVSGTLVGLFGGESRSAKHRATIGQAATAFVWCGGGSLALLMFWIHLPVALSRSRVVAREREAEADELLGSEPSKSVMLYRAALSLACDPEYEAELGKKLHDIDKRLSSTGVLSGGSNRDGLVAGRYRIVEELGRGANGVVYRADDSVLGRHVALKELPLQLSNDDFVVPRFRQEARVLAKLNHPNIVQVYDFIEHGGRMWMAIELVEAGDLASFLKSRGSLPAPEAAWFGRQMADAVAFAHDRGVVHRDLKPLNVLLADDHTPKITDFGLAKLTEGSVHTVEGTVMGSPHYMSPEQADGRPVDNRADVYSLGVILYQMLTGRVPFEGDIASVLAQHVRKPPPPPRKVAPDNQIPPKLERLVLAMLAKKPDDRPDKMGDISTELARISQKPTPSLNIKS